MGEGPANALERCLQRIDAAMEALDDFGDAEAGTVARELVDAVLDLHGLALAKAIVIIQDGADGDALAARLAGDDYVAAALLLHGLHPEEPETRLRRKIAAMRPHWGVRGFRVEFVAVDGSIATARILWSDETLDRRAALREVERALTDSAPDLDEIRLEEVHRGTSDHSMATALQT
ncbi:MAG TPA: hypothetical protein VK446_07900 [Methylocystis sp.]|nr:hypothetical protein [Methylocystis sp.]